MEVDKTQFDAVLGKLLKAPPLPKSAIPKKARRKNQSQKQQTARSEPAGQ
jgi:hypothetical protein